MSIYERLFDALSSAGVRFVVVGGVAVVLHGYARLTADVDLVIDLEPANALRAIDTLLALGYRSALPLDAKDFADPAVRRVWVEERHMQVFSMQDPADPLLTVDLFAREPLPFEPLWSRARSVTIGREPVRIACIEDLIALKRAAGRPQDAIDIERLEQIERKRRT